MKSSILKSTMVLVGGLGALALGAAEPSDVLVPAKRIELIDQWKKTLRPGEVAEVAIANPFYPEGFAGSVAESNRPVDRDGTSEPSVAVQAGPRSSKEILQTIAQSLKPSGYFVLSGQQTLVFGQKRVKAGGTLTITFEGTEYTLEIVSIDRTHFTLRLNREEFTRPIK